MKYRYKLHRCDIFECWTLKMTARVYITVIIHFEDDGQYRK